MGFNSVFKGLILYLISAAVILLASPALIVRFWLPYNKARRASV